jgi:hypothetical protein
MPFEVRDEALSSSAVSVLLVSWAGETATQGRTLSRRWRSLIVMPLEISTMLARAMLKSDVCCRDTSDGG